MLVFIFINPPLLACTHIYMVIFHATAAFTTYPLYTRMRLIYVHIYKVISFSLYLFFSPLPFPVPKKKISQCRQFSAR